MREANAPSLEDIQKFNRFALMVNEFRKIEPEIPAQQISTFMAIAMEPGITITDAGTKAGVGLGSVSRHIEALGKPRVKASGKTVGLGLITVSEGVFDRRIRTVALSAKGQRVAATILDLLSR